MPDPTSEAPSPADQDPVTPDTQDPADTGDTAPNTQAAPAAPNATEGRFRALQVEFARRYPDAEAPDPTGDIAQDYKALQREWTRLNAQPTDDDQPAQEPSYKERWEQESWQRAEGIYGLEAVEAYGAFSAAYEKDPTPFGLLTAMEVYHQTRLGQAAPQDADGKPNKEAAAAAVTPRVDSNRSDASPDLALSAKEEEARKIGGDAGLVSLISDRIGAALNR